MHTGVIGGRPSCPCCVLITRKMSSLAVSAAVSSDDEFFISLWRIHPHHCVYKWQEPTILQVSTPFWHISPNLSNHTTITMDLANSTDTADADLGVISWWCIEHHKLNLATWRFCKQQNTLLQHAISDTLHVPSTDDQPISNNDSACGLVSFWQSQLNTLAGPCYVLLSD